MWLMSNVNSTFFFGDTVCRQIGVKEWINEFPAPVFLILWCRCLKIIRNTVQWWRGSRSDWAWRDGGLRQRPITWPIAFALLWNRCPETSRPIVPPHHWLTADRAIHHVSTRGRWIAHFTLLAIVESLASEFQRRTERDKRDEADWGWWGWSGVTELGWN